MLFCTSLLTLGAHAQRGLQYLGLSVCLSGKSHLTYGASVRPENAVTYSAGNEGQNICGVYSENAPLLRSSRVARGGATPHAHNSSTRTIIIIIILKWQP